MSAIKNLKNLLNIEKISDNTFRASVNEFGWTRVFGGLIVAQSIIASYRTVKDKNLHSLHSYFLRAGDPDITMNYEVNTLREGRSFAQRIISAYQSDKLVFYMIASFQKKEKGLEYQEKMPRGIVTPENLKTEMEILDDVFENKPDNIKDTRHRGRAIEFRPIKPRDITMLKNEDPLQLLWFKTSAKTDLDPIMNQALLAYASDYTILDTTLMPHGISIFQKDIQVASLDHSIWFHDSNFDINEWTLYSQKSPKTSGNRGFAEGMLYSYEGNLIATVAQEGMIRKMPTI